LYFFISPTHEILIGLPNKIFIINPLLNRQLFLKKEKVKQKPKKQEKKIQKWNVDGQSIPNARHAFHAWDVACQVSLLLTPGENYTRIRTL